LNSNILHTIISGYASFWTEHHHRGPCMLSALNESCLQHRPCVLATRRSRRPWMTRYMLRSAFKKRSRFRCCVLCSKSPTRGARARHIRLCTREWKQRRISARSSAHVRALHIAVMTENLTCLRSCFIASRGGMCRFASRTAQASAAKVASRLPSQMDTGVHVGFQGALCIQAETSTDVRDRAKLAPF
jgi:hypothetical protein